MQKVFADGVLTFRVAMRILKRFFLGLLVLIALAAAGLYLTGNEHILYGLPPTYLSGSGRPDIDDAGWFDLREVDAGEHTPWAKHPQLSTRQLAPEDAAYCDSLGTVAYLVVHRGKIVLEQYFEDYDQDTRSNSFSMAKSFTSLAVGAAQERGLLKISDPVGKYIGRFNEGSSSELTIEHLLQMRSNIDFGESYTNPFGYQAKAYYGTDLLALTAPYRVSGVPGTTWAYEGGNTVILGEIVQQVSGKTLSEFFSETVWSRIGCQHDAYWNLDREGGMEKAFSGYYATARDFARIGEMMRNGGAWNGTQIVSEDWVEASIQPVNRPDRNGRMTEHYGYQWWLAPQNAEPWHFAARGMRGQYIVVVPEHELVVVRLGHNRDETRDEGATMSPDLPRLIEIGMKWKD